MSKKYIHYCWFGGKPLPRLAKKCIKSWKKYLPDYEIIRWSEKNVDLNECPFIKEAYENKKWAFVADYARTKAMYEYGGIYFDTDMIVTKNIDFLLNNETFLGIEDSGFIACGVWYEKHPKSYLSERMLEFYKNLDGFENDNTYSISIPKIITELLIPMGFDSDKIDVLQKLKNDIFIYPRDYFYPYSYNWENNIFTENTCMIHYYDASWVPKWEQRENKIIRTFGKKNGEKIISFSKDAKKIIKKIIKVPLYPLVLYKRKKNIERNIKELKDNLEKVADNKYVVIHNPEWLGTSSSTKELFKNTLPIKELYNKKEIEEIASIISQTNLKLIVFSGLSIGWDLLINDINKFNSNINIKVLWHGSNAMHIEDYDWEVFNNVFNLLKQKKIKSIGFVKKSMYELYKEKGYNVEFVMNNVHLSNDLKKNTMFKKHDNIKIGLYASGDRWVKNFYNQLAAASLIENVEIDCIPLSNKAIEFSNLLNIKLNGNSNLINRIDLIKRMSMNDINIYTTFVECAPIIPLESLEMGVPCITGNNHHYWENTELEKYLIVNKVDNPIEIKNKIELCLKNKDKIIKLYHDWKKEYDKISQKSVDDFVNIED